MRTRGVSRRLGSREGVDIQLRGSDGGARGCCRGHAVQEPLLQAGHRAGTRPKRCRVTQVLTGGHLPSEVGFVGDIALDAMSAVVDAVPLKSCVEGECAAGGDRHAVAVDGVESAGGVAEYDKTARPVR